MRAPKRDIDYDKEVDELLKLARLTPVIAAYMVILEDGLHLRATLGQALEIARGTEVYVVRRMMFPQLSHTRNGGC